MGAGFAGLNSIWGWNLILQLSNFKKNTIFLKKLLTFNYFFANIVFAAADEIKTTADKMKINAG